MGMDVFGKRPKNEDGKYFRANVWYWRPIWFYMEEHHPTLASKVEHSQTNDGDGLNSRDSLALSRLLKSDIDSGRLSQYINDHNQYLDSLPLEDCKYCDENGNRTITDDEGLTTVRQCNSCSGSRKVQSIKTYYRMDLDLMIQFQKFLENCGGFEIW